MNINEFYKNIKKKYPNTKEVLEQLDEIKDMLNSKVQHYVKNGMKYEEACSKSIDEIYKNINSFNIIFFYSYFSFYFWCDYR